MLENQTSNVSLNFNGESPLYLATVVGRKTIIHFSTIKSRLVTTLLRHGVNPNEHSQDNIPLLSALEERDIQTANLLLEAGANVNAKNHEGKSGLHTIFGPNSKTIGIYKSNSFLKDKNISTR